MPRSETDYLHQLSDGGHDFRSEKRVSAKRILVISAIAFTCLGALIFLDSAAPFAYVRTRDLLRDAIARAGRTTPPNPDLVFLAIDSDSVSLEEGADVEELYGLTDTAGIEAKALRLMSKRWPWSREIYSLVMERLLGAGAKVVLFDLTFPMASDDDKPFALALDKYRDRVVIGSNFVSGTSRGFTTIGASHTRPPDSLVPQTVPMDDRVAFTNFWPDEDDAVRRAQYCVTFEQVQGRWPEAGSERFLSLGARALVKAGFGGAVPAGLDDHLFRYTAPPRRGFAPHSLFEIFVPDYWQHNYKSGEFFRDKIVIVGAEGNWQHDEHPTPFGSMPGPEVHLNAMNAALHHEFIREVPLLGRIVMAVIGAAIAVALSLRIRSPWWRLATLVALNVGAACGALAVFNYLSVYLPMVGPAGALDLTVLMSLMSDLAGERIEKKKLRSTLERYVSKNVVSDLIDHPQSYTRALGGVMKPATILFSDIRGYSSVSARTDPQALVAQLNEYLTAMVECVFRFGGTLDKFIGDAVMAVWGNARSDGVREDALNALRAALAMREELVKLNRSWRARGLSELNIGIALNHGEVVVGNIGSPQRMEFTVIGDAVNVSWKLQEQTKHVGSDLIISQTVASLVVEHFELRALGAVEIAGLSTPFEIFAVQEPIKVMEGAHEAVCRGGDSNP